MQKSDKPTSNPIYIYALIDPRQPQVVRYVGQTKDIKQRLKMHERNSERNRLGNWAFSLKQAKIPLSYHILELTDRKSANAREQFWIQQCISPFLLNREAKTVVEKVADVLPLGTVNNETADRLEKLVIETALEQCGWNINATHDLLAPSYSRATIYTKIKQYGLEEPAPQYCPLERHKQNVLDFITLNRGSSISRLCRQFHRELSKRDVDVILESLFKEKKIFKNGDNIEIPGMTRKALPNAPELDQLLEKHLKSLRNQPINALTRYLTPECQNAKVEEKKESVEGGV